MGDGILVTSGLLGFSTFSGHVWRSQSVGEKNRGNGGVMVVKRGLDGTQSASGGAKRAERHCA
jgi:hypothetical protein